MLEEKNPSIAVLLPCYNEEVTIGKVVRDFRVALPDAAIYVYDNNSTDRTAEIAAAPDMVAKVLEGYDMVIGDRLSSKYIQDNRRRYNKI